MKIKPNVFHYAKKCLLANSHDLWGCAAPFMLNSEVKTALIIILGLMFIFTAQYIWLLPEVETKL